jgi:ParB family chromosome partitioning protein
LIEEFSLTHAQVAETVGRSRAAVTNLIRLLDLPESVVTLIDSKALSMGHARALLGLEDGAERVRLSRLVVERGLSVRDTEHLVRKASIGEAGQPAKKSTSSATSAVLKTKTVHARLHQKSSGAARIVIDVADAKSCEVIVEAIKGAVEQLGDP